MHIIERIGHKVITRFSRLENIRYSVRLGRVFDRSKNFYFSVMDGFDEKVLPTSVSLGCIEGVASMVDADGNRDQVTRL